jgi:hypothetical protein
VVEIVLPTLSSGQLWPGSSCVQIVLKWSLAMDPSRVHQPSMSHSPFVAGQLHYSMGFTSWFCTIGKSCNLPL